MPSMPLISDLPKLDPAASLRASVDSADALVVSQPRIWSFTCHKILEDDLILNMPSLKS